MPQPFVSGFVRLTASGSVGDAGKAQWISGYSLDSGGTAANPYFINGSSTVSAGNSIAWRAGGGVISTTSAQQAVGQLPVALPLGCYVSFDANTTAITVFYVQALT
jgi:hypothetical protein